MHVNGINYLRMDMITNFKIENFRLFDNIEINKLNSVNLIVGKNSSGKSALLEAFLLYFSDVSIDVLMECLSSRQEDWFSTENRYSSHGSSNPIRHLFKNHMLPELHEEGFKLSSNLRFLHVRTAGYVTEKTETGFLHKILNPDEIKNYSDVFLEQVLYLEEGNASRLLLPLNNEFRDMKQTKMRKNNNQSIPCQFVSAIGISDAKASSLWDAISLTDLEKEVLNGIKLVEPDATGITFVEYSGDQRSPRIPLVKLKNMQEPVPLKSLGDGMTRLFQIILSLVSAKDGVLIVDEFENGLHWSVQNDAWNIIFKLSAKLNVQVFCSTHSRDCIKSFGEIWNENKKLAHFMRVVKKDGVATLKEYDLELLNDSLETDVEVR